MASDRQTHIPKVINSGSKALKHSKDIAAHCPQMYRLFGAAVACDLPLPGVPACWAGRADIRIELGRGDVVETGYDPVHSWREKDGELVLSCARRQEEDATIRYLLRFPDLADFVIAGDTVICHPHPDCRDDSLRHLVLDQVIPRLWAHRGHLVLHAGAVCLPDGRVIAFLGDSGWGKSTLAAALEERGSRLISDDCVTLRASDAGVSLVPSYTGLRLNEDSIATLGLADQRWTSVSHYSEKRQIEPATPVHQQPLLLDTLFVMDEPDPCVSHLTVKPLSGASLVPALIKRSFLLDPRDNPCATRQLQEASAVVRAVRMCILAYPREYLQLPALCDGLLGEIAAVESAL